MMIYWIPFVLFLIIGGIFFKRIFSLHNLKKQSNWRYSTARIRYQALSDPNRKMEMTVPVRGDFERGIFQIKSQKPRSSGYYTIDESNGNYQRVREAVRETKYNDEFELMLNEKTSSYPSTFQKKQSET